MEKSHPSDNSHMYLRSTDALILGWLQLRGHFICPHYYPRCFNFLKIFNDSVFREPAKINMLQCETWPSPSKTAIPRLEGVCDCPAAPSNQHMVSFWILSMDLSCLILPDVLKHLCMSNLTRNWLTFKAKSSPSWRGCFGACTCSVGEREEVLAGRGWGERRGGERERLRIAAGEKKKKKSWAQGPRAVHSV